MIFAKSVNELSVAIERLCDRNNIGFVPTMGALHEGHVSLVREAKKDCSHVVVSVFVNPTQFNDPKDLQNYPRDIEKDMKLLEKEGVDIIFAPGVEDVYPKKDDRLFDLNGLDKYGEGARRTGHFSGVAQVVTRLFDLVTPKKAFFGEKDFQQLSIIKYLTQSLGYPVEIVSCPTFREKDGLAMSSRNALLSDTERKEAPFIYKMIQKATSLKGNYTPQEVIEMISGEINSNTLMKCEYIEIVDSATLKPISSWTEANDRRLCCAVFMGNVRLIDNIKI